MQHLRLGYELLLFLFVCKTLAAVPKLHKASRKFINQCLHLEDKSYFEPNMVVGARPWRIYHTWNWQLESPGKCLDMVFKNATKDVINRIYLEMGDYMLMQPPWNDAAMVMTLGDESHELLLFNDMYEGKFLAVPNIIRDSQSLTPEKNSVPYLHITLKLLLSNKFLLMLDCNLGIVTLSSRIVPYRSEVFSAVRSVNLGDGFVACSHNRNDDEMIGE